MALDAVVGDGTAAHVICLPVLAIFRIGVSMEVMMRDFMFDVWEFVAQRVHGWRINMRGQY